MSQNRTKQILLNLACMGMGLLFLWAALGKISSMDQFAKSLASYGFLPIFLKYAAYYLVPGIELILGFMFLFRVDIRQSSALAMALFSVFILFGFATMMTGTQGHSCPCFKAPEMGVFSSVLNGSGWWLIFRNAVFIGVCFWIYRVVKTFRHKDETYSLAS